MQRIRLSDVADLDLGVLSTVAFLFTEALAALLFVGNYFFTLHMIQDLGLYFYAYCTTYSEVAIGVSQKHFRKFNFVSSVATYVGHVQSLIFLHLKLLAGYFYYCEHNGSKIRTAKVARKILLTNK